MKINSSSPIGIFDSGIGGLTVASAIRQVLPNESMVYFGDTAHLPYGDKSEAAVQAYSIKIADILLKKGCKVIVIACNSASSAAYELLKEYVGSRSFILNVIDPMVEHVVNQYADQKVGLIGTKRTVNSNVYQKKISEYLPEKHLYTLATPLLVPMIEEGFFNNKISEEIIDKYLHDPVLEDIEALILGCTHYPLIKTQIDQFYKGQVSILDSSLITAEHVKATLQSKDLLHPDTAHTDEFIVSDYTSSFEESTKIFFDRHVDLQHYPLWD